MYSPNSKKTDASGEKESKNTEKENAAIKRAVTVQHSAMAFGGGVGGFLKRTTYKQSKIAMMIKLSSDSIKKAQAEAASIGNDDSEEISSSDEGPKNELFAKNEKKSKEKASKLPSAGSKLPSVIESSYKDSISNSDDSKPSSSKSSESVSKSSIRVKSKQTPK